jgi:hypothetical protein
MAKQQANDLNYVASRSQKRIPAHKADSADEGESRAHFVREGKSQAEQGAEDSPADTLLFELLRKELEAIGRIEQSMKPAALGSYKTLLTCREVERRLGSQPTQDERQRAAHAALIDAIEALPTSRDQRIAEAILAATDEYEGYNVDERKRILDKRADGCSPDIYKRRRPKIIERLTRYLIREIDDTKSLDNQTDYILSLDNLKCLFEDVAHFRYCCLTYSFVVFFDGQLTALDNQPLQLRHNQRSIEDALYRSYTDLVLSGGYCFENAFYSSRDEILANLPAGIVGEISTKLTYVYDLMPFSEGARVQYCVNRFDLPLSLADYRATRKTLYLLDWKHWAQANLHFDSSEKSDLLGKIIAGCTRLLLFANNVLKADQDTELLVDEAAELVAGYYGIDQSRAILDSQSLYKHFCAYTSYQDTALYFASPIFFD